MGPRWQHFGARPVVVVVVAEGWQLEILVDWTPSFAEVVIVMLLVPQTRNCEEKWLAATVLEGYDGRWPTCSVVCTEEPCAMLPNAAFRPQDSQQAMVTGCCYSDLSSDPFFSFGARWYVSTRCSTVLLIQYCYRYWNVSLATHNPQILCLSLPRTHSSHHRKRSYAVEVFEFLGFVRRITWNAVVDYWQWRFGNRFSKPKPKQGRMRNLSCCHLNKITHKKVNCYLYPFVPRAHSNLETLPQNSVITTFNIHHIFSITRQLFWFHQVTCQIVELSWTVITVLTAAHCKVCVRGIAFTSNSHCVHF